MPYREIFLASVSVAFALARIGGIRGDLFKDAAHMLIAGLAVAWCYERRRFFAIAFWSLNIVEVACAYRDHKAKIDAFISSFL